MLCLRKEFEKLQALVLVSSSVKDLLWLWARQTASVGGQLLFSEVTISPTLYFPSE